MPYPSAIAGSPETRPHPPHPVVPGSKKIIPRAKKLHPGFGIFHGITPANPRSLAHKKTRKTVRNSLYICIYILVGG